MMITRLTASACVFATAVFCFGATTQPAPKEVDRESGHLARVEERLKKHPQLATNPYIRLDLGIARRFIHRATHLDPAKAKQQEPQWTATQMDEVGQVLVDAEK